MEASQEADDYQDDEEPEEESGDEGSVYEADEEERPKGKRSRAVVPRSASASRSTSAKEETARPIKDLPAFAKPTPPCPHPNTLERTPGRFKQWYDGVIDDVGPVSDCPLCNQAPASPCRRHAWGHRYHVANRLLEGKKGCRPEQNAMAGGFRYTRSSFLLMASRDIERALLTPEGASEALSDELAKFLGVYSTWDPRFLQSANQHKVPREDDLITGGLPKFERKSYPLVWSAAEDVGRNKWLTEFRCVCLNSKGKHPVFGRPDVLQKHITNQSANPKNPQPHQWVTCGDKLMPWGAFATYTGTRLAAEGADTGPKAKAPSAESSGKGKAQKNPSPLQTEGAGSSKKRKAPATKPSSKGKKRKSDTP